MLNPFLKDMHTLTRQHGRQLTHETAPILHSYYLDEAYEAGHDIPKDSNLGRIAIGTKSVGELSVSAEVSVLNESFGTMPDYGSGQKCGQVEILAREIIAGKSVYRADALWLSFDMTVNKSIVLTAGGVDRSIPEMRRVMQDLGLTDGGDEIDMPTTYLCVEKSGIDGVLDSNRTQKLSNMVLCCFALQQQIE